MERARRGIKFFITNRNANIRRRLFPPATAAAAANNFIFLDRYRSIGLIVTRAVFGGFRLGAGPDIGDRAIFFPGAGRTRPEAYFYFMRRDDVCHVPFSL